MELYKEEEFEKVKEQKKRVLTIFYISLGIFLAINLGIFIYYLTLPYGSKIPTMLQVIHNVLTIIYIVFLFVFMGVKFSRIKKYSKIMGHIKTGLKENNHGEFLRFSDDIEVKDGVDFYTMIMSEWYEKKQDYYERRVFIDNEKPKPIIHEGDIVNYITQGNILLSYEIESYASEDDMDDLKNEENIENIEKVENVENIEKVEKLENVENVEKIEKVENVENIENIEKVENVENNDKRDEL